MELDERFTRSVVFAKTIVQNKDMFDDQTMIEFSNKFLANVKLFKKVGTNNSVARGMMSEALDHFDSLIENLLVLYPHNRFTLEMLNVEIPGES